MISRADEPNASLEPPRLLLTPREAAESLAMSERKLWELTHRGELPRLKIDRLVRYSVADLQAYVERLRQADGA